MGLGLEYTYPLTKTGLGLFLGIDINYNRTNSDYKDNIVDASDGFIDEDDITFPSHFNIPISVGLNYTFKADDKLSVYTNLGLVSKFL